MEVEVRAAKGSDISRLFSKSLVNGCKIIVLLSDWPWLLDWIIVAANKALMSQGMCACLTRQRINTLVAPHFRDGSLGLESWITASVPAACAFLERLTNQGR